MYNKSHTKTIRGSTVHTQVIRRTLNSSSFESPHQKHTRHLKATARNDGLPRRKHDAVNHELLRYIGLWRAAYDLGIIADASAETLTRFFEHSSGDIAPESTSSSKISMLRDLICRNSSYRWNSGEPKLELATAQWNRLSALSSHKSRSTLNMKHHAAGIDNAAHRITGKRGFILYDLRDWEKLHRTWGEEIRRLTINNG